MECQRTFLAQLRWFVLFLIAASTMLFVSDRQKASASDLLPAETLNGLTGPPHPSPRQEGGSNVPSVPCSQGIRYEARSAMVYSGGRPWDVKVADLNKDGR